LLSKHKLNSLAALAFLQNNAILTAMVNKKQRMNNTEIKIFNEAKSLFFTQGYYNTTIRQIAEAAGVNSGLFNYYFQNKFNLARRIYNTIFDNIIRILEMYFSDEENPAIYLGILMRMHTWLRNDKRIILFAVDAMKEEIFEDAVRDFVKPYIEAVDHYYKANLSDEEHYLMIAASLGAEKAIFTQNYLGNIHFDIKRLSVIFYRIHLFHYNISSYEIDRCNDVVTKRFQALLDQYPNFIDDII
jgi:AcrR family transcriptional regulator